MDLVSLARAVPSATAVGLAGLGYGGLLPRPAGRATPLETPWAIGLGLVGMLVMAVGFLRLLGTVSLAVVVGAGVGCLALPFVRRRIGADRKPARATLVVLLLFLPVTVASLVPPVFFDSAVYHVALPAVYLSRGNLDVLPESNYSFYPSTAEMLYTASLGLSGVPESCAPLHLLAALLTTLAAASFAARLVGEAAAPMAALLFASVPSVLAQAAIPKNDLFVAAFFGVGLVCLADLIDGEGSSLMLGLALGLTLATKYTAIYLVAAVASVTLVRFAKIPAIRRRLTAAFALAALLPSPWYLRSFLASGNPVYPALPGFFGNAPFQRVGFLMPAERRDLPFLKLLKLPFHLSAGETGYGIFSNYGPLLLMMVVLALLTRARVRRLWLLASCCLLALLAWWKTFNDARYLVPLLPIVAAIGAAGFVSAVRRGKAMPRLIGAAVALMVLSNLAAPARNGHSAGALGLLAILMDPVPYIVGRETREEYLARTYPPYESMAFANGHLSKESRILFIGETRGLYLDVPYVANTAHDRTVIVDYIKKAKDLADLLRRLRQHRFTHILINRPELSRLQEYGPYLHFDKREEWSLFGAFMKKMTQNAVFRDVRHGTSLHRLPSADG